jgi:hypothetical protein
MTSMCMKSNRSPHVPVTSVLITASGGGVVGEPALSQVWLFLVVPTVSGIFAGALFRSGVLAIQQQKAGLTEAARSKAHAA